MIVTETRILRAHYYRETPKLQAGTADQRRERTMEGGKEKRKKASERGGTSLPLVPRSNGIPKNENFTKPGIPKQQQLPGLSYRMFHECSFTEHSARSRVVAMKECRGRFLRDISTEKATNFVPI